MPRVSKRKLQISWVISIFLASSVGIYTLTMLYYPWIVWLSENPQTIPGVSIGKLYKEPYVYKFLIDTLTSLGLDSLTFIADMFFDIVDLTFISIILLFILPAYYYRKDFNWRNSVDDALPSFLREIGDAQKVGLPLPRAVIEASKREYGPLTDELKLMASKMSWGVGFHESLLRMRNRIQTSLFNRTSVLILEAERAGGSIEDVFEAAYNHVSELLAVRRERSAAMKSYTWIIYAAYLVFVIVIVILLQTFFNTMAQQSVAYSQTSVESSIQVANIIMFQLLFLHLLMIQGAFSGIVAGKMGSGDAYLGLTHNIVLCSLGYIVFKIMVVIV
ncbi:MAG: type II secretion system F family protein [Candidatus Hodarchaeales archaeon]